MTNTEIQNIIEKLEDFSALWDKDFKFLFFYLGDQIIEIVITTRMENISMEQWLLVYDQYCLITESLIKRLEKIGIKTETIPNDNDDKIGYVNKEKVMEWINMREHPHRSEITRIREIFLTNVPHSIEIKING